MTPSRPYRGSRGCMYPTSSNARVWRRGYPGLLSGITCHFLLMTATPHDGKEEDFQLFMRLLDADRFERYFRGGRARKVDTADVMRCMIKEDLENLLANSTPPS